MLLSSRTGLLSLSLSFGSAFGALFNDPSQLPKKSYDYIVVGSGAGGGVIGTRLSEDSGVNVLVIEAGENNVGHENLEIPFFGPTLAPNTQFDWNFTTTPQVALNGRTMSYNRGHVLGGSTSINYMVYTRGSRDDFDRWANVTGDSGWSWDSLIPYMKKSEKLVHPADNHNTAGEIDPKFHGTSGPVSVSIPGFGLPTDARVIKATQELPDQFPFNEDMNSGNTIGVGWCPYTIGNGQRASSATSYLQPNINRPNLDVLVNTLVTKLIQTGTQSGSPIFRGVQFGTASGAKLFSLNATTEVILSAGAVKTPHILMLSGIGDSSELGKFGIKTIVNNPNVGKNLQDHVLLSNPFTVNSTNTFDEITQNATFAAQVQQQWETSHTGVLVDGPANQIGWLRIPDNSTIYKTIKDPSAGPTSGHYELIFTNGFVSFDSPTPATGNYFSLFTNAVSTASRGTISLGSSNPFDAPLIDPALLESDFDAFTMVEAIKAGKTFMAADAWKGWILEPFGDFANANTDAEIEAYVRRSATTVYHPVGSAAMAPKASKDGVANPDLTVKGVVGLRIVDASVFPFIPAAHTQTSVYILAERAADLIKAAHPSNNKC